MGYWEVESRKDEKERSNCETKVSAMKVKHKLKVTDGLVMKGKEEYDRKSWKRRLRWVEKRAIRRFQPK